jgi:hypothetical protein
MEFLWRIIASLVACQLMDDGSVNYKGNPSFAIAKMKVYYQSCLIGEDLSKQTATDQLIKVS